MFPACFENRVSGFLHISLRLNMRDFLLNSEELLDKHALELIRKEGASAGLFACSWVHYNERVKIVFYTDDRKPLSEQIAEFSLDEVCRIGQSILRNVLELQKYPEISPENVVWDQESIYVDEERNAHLICLPAIIPQESRQSDIYAKRLYALLEDMVSEKDGGDFVYRQIEYQKEKAFGDWNGLITTLGLREHDDSDGSSIVLKSINTPEPLTFYVRRENFKIGTDPGEADGFIKGVETVDPVHAVIGWNEINYYVTDMNSENGTYVNDQRIAPGTEVPIGEGTVLRFADYTFNVE